MFITKKIHKPVKRQKEIIIPTNKNVENPIIFAEVKAEEAIVNPEPVVEQPKETKKKTTRVKKEIPVEDIVIDKEVKDIE